MADFQARNTDNSLLTLVDIITTIFIIFLLVDYLDDFLNTKNIELAYMIENRDEFVDFISTEFERESQIDSSILFIKEIDHLRIKFSDKILFKVGQYALNDSGEDIIKRLIAKIKSSEYHTNILSEIQVEGHTDEIPLTKANYPKNNWELSTARALEVVTKSISLGLTDSLFSANGYASNRPYSQSDIALNRRIEMKFFFKSNME